MSGVDGRVFFALVFALVFALIFALVCALVCALEFPLLNNPFGFDGGGGPNNPFGFNGTFGGGSLLFVVLFKKDFFGLGGLPGLTA